MKTASCGRRGSGVARDGAHRGRGRSQNVPAPKTHEKKATMLSFMSPSQGQRRMKTTTLTKSDHCEQVVSWIGSDGSSSTFSPSQSIVSSQGSAQPSPPPYSKDANRDQISDPALGFTEELFSGPLFQLILSPDTVQNEEILCPNSQLLELPQSPTDGGGHHVRDYEHLDDDETQLPESPHPGQLQSQDDEVIHETQMSFGDTAIENSSISLDEEVLDDEVSDPTWEAENHSQDSGTDNEASAARQTLVRDRVVAREERRATLNRPINVRRSTSLRKSAVPRARSSVVWNFFKESPDDKRMVICNLCHSKLSRGIHMRNLSTTSMLRHMQSRHRNTWEEHQGPKSASVGHSTPSSSPVLGAAGEVAGPNASHTAPVPFSGPPSTTSTPMSQGSVQLSVPDAFDRKRKFASNHPQAISLNAQLAKLLALEMLPFRLVDTEAFRSLMSVAVPRYAVPSRYYFARSAMPALHQHVSKNITHALTNAVSGKVHLTTDTWTSACGQGRYISLTAHWVNVVEAGSISSPGMAQVLPTPRLSSPTSLRVSTSTHVRGSSFSSTSSSSSSDLSPCSSVGPSVGSWKFCSTAVGKRQQAVLKLICLGDKKHTAAELWQGISEEMQLWFSPLNLQPGMVVSDNGRNLVAALELANLTHIPCLAHVFNLVVQRFLKTYPDLQQLLVRVRRVCAHFRKSSTASATLSTLQQHFKIPVHRLMCDVTTRWNSTFHMLSRLCEQKRAVAEYQMQHGRRLSTQLPQISNYEWALMSDVCEVLRNFEESTKMVSGDNAIVSVTIPLLCLLKSSLVTIRDEALQVEELEMREDITQGGSQATLTSSQFQCNDDEEEEEEQEMLVSATEGTADGRLIASVQRGWAEEEEEDEESDPQEEEFDESLTVGSLAHMADFMLGCLTRDPRVIHILNNADYWLFALLDPRYKQNFPSLIPVGERASKLQQYHNALVDKLLVKFTPTHDGSRVHCALSNAVGDTRGRAQSSSSRGRATLSKAWDSFLTQRQHPHPDGRPTASRRERFRKMVKDYLADDIIIVNDPSVPYNYWVSKLDVWNELALYALEVLACPAASVLSERVFSAAGGIITDKRTRLSTANADRLTHIKMNKGWIGPEFSTPTEESR